MRSEGPEGSSSAPAGGSTPTDGRRRTLEALARKPLDLLIIGGGITGAGVARDAALRGMRVGLVEKGDFGGGTSSRSSKIIHGGVRYLEYLQLRLVRESARERSILRRIAPHLVHPLKFLYPVFEGESLLKVRLGLRLFDLLAGSAPDERSVRLSPTECRKHLPGLRDPLKGAILYPEFITDDARFTLANVLSASDHGALVVNYARAEAFLRRGERVTGVAVRDVETNTIVEIQAEVTVNATGPWAGDLLSANGLRSPERLIPSKGIHILLSRARLPLGAATFLRSSIGRRGLAMPRGPWVYVGTSDAEYRGDLDAVRAEEREIAELLEMTRDCFPAAGLTIDDVEGSWAGVRPLVFEPGKTTRETSRHDRIWIGPPGLVTVAGGKLTTYRPMASRILRAVGRARGRTLPGTGTTDRVPLSGTPEESLTAYRETVRARLSEHGVSDATLRRFEFLYGTEVETLLQYATESQAWMEPLFHESSALRGEVRLAVETGLARTLPDVLDRRMALLLFGKSGGLNAAAAAADVMAALLGWDSERQKREVDEYARLAREHRRIAR